MRSLNLKRMQSFATFDLPVNYNYIYTKFRQTHEDYGSVYTFWPTAASRYKLISGYWENALRHYLLLVAVSSLFVVITNSPSIFWNSIQLSMLLIMATLAYIPIYHFVYRPTFNNDFLPKLETAIIAYEGKEQAWLDKCKQDQLSNRALVLLFYVLEKTSKLSFLSPTDRCADQLHQIFGVSPKGMKNELELIFKNDKLVKPDSRHYFEVFKSFGEAYDLLESIEFNEGVQHLKELELRLKKRFSSKIS
ncbi:hypothetical protein HGH93_02455 [Chitinophaga polysaccharea]|uniref:hypothetical protein n=1 Tax=Chitinophaga polysaccharea TaxID=1293035 RepID=UPI00145558DB|nr:hypothetical protein [Chitinophaga polysaccharea]NLR56945.1 hypothetical protein [Chitinophaga polysaccharea]